MLAQFMLMQRDWQTMYDVRFKVRQPTLNESRQSTTNSALRFHLNQRTSISTMCWHKQERLLRCIVTIFLFRTVYKTPDKISNGS